MAPRKNPIQLRQERLVIAGALFIIAVSVFSTLWFSGILFRGAGSSGNYQNITFTDALITCEAESREQYGDKLLRIVNDDHSSRYDGKSNQYKIFFKATMASQKSESGISEFFINCYVNADRGRIADYDVYENKEQRTEAIRKDEGGMFGWPNKN